MSKPEAKSFKQLTISVEKLPSSMGRQNQYATQRARLLLGCYRIGEANDPETYVAAVAATLAHYPQEIITEITHPVTGLPSRQNWLPTVKEVHDACEIAAARIAQRVAREKRIAEQLAQREEFEKRDCRPTVEELKARYGEHWGIQKPSTNSRPDEVQRTMQILTDRMKLREYEAADLEPIYTSDGMLISLSLAKLVGAR